MRDYRVSLIQILSGAAIFGAGIFIPILARQELGASDFEIGLIVSFYGISLFVSSYAFGRAADMHGRRPYLVGGLLVTGLACLVLLYTPNLPYLLGARVLMGLAGGIFPSALTAYAYEKGIKMGKYSSNMAIGFGSGAIVAGLIVLLWGEAGNPLGRAIYNPVFVGCSAMLFVCFAVSLTMTFPETQKFKIPFIPWKILRHNLGIYLSILVRHTGAAAVWAFFALFVYFFQPADTPQHVRFFWIGIINGANGLCQFIFMRNIDRLDHRHLMVAGFGLSVVTFLLFTIVQDIWQLLLAQAVLALAFSCLYVGAICQIMERNPEHATSAGLLNSMLNASQVIGPLVGGLVASAFAASRLDLFGFVIGGSEIAGYKGIMYLAAVMSLVAMVIYYVWYSRDKAATPPPNSSGPVPGQ